METIKIEVEYRTFKGWEIEALKKEAANITGRALARTMLGSEHEPAEMAKDTFEMKEISERLDEIVKTEENKTEIDTEK